MKLLTLSTLFLTFLMANTALADSAFTSCVLDRGIAKGYIYSSSAKDYSGVGEIFFFNSAGELVDTKNVGQVSGRLDSNDSELVVETPVPARTAFCTFVIEANPNQSPVIPVDGVPTGIKFSSQCSIQDGEIWFSYIQNKGRRVTLRSVVVNFLDSSGRHISSQQVANQICLREAQRIVLDKATPVPTRAVKCRLSIDSDTFSGCAL